MATPFNNAVQAAAAAYSKDQWNALEISERNRLIYAQIKIMDKINLTERQVPAKVMN